MGLTKQQLEALNNSSFPNNNSGYITPAILRSYNSETITNTVNQDSYSTDSASFDSRIDAIDIDTASFASTASFNSFTQSYYTDSASVDSRLDTLNTDKVNNSQTASMAVSSSNYSVTSSYTLTAAQSDTMYIWSDIGNANRYLAFTEGGGANQQVRIDTIGGITYNPSTNTLNANVISASTAISASSINGIGNVAAFSASVDSRINAITSSGGGAVGYLTTGSTLTDTQYISGALVFTGSARIQIASASFVNIGGGQSTLSLQYEPSASALSYLEVNTNLPQHLNQAIKVGAITSGSIVGGFVKVMRNPSLVATGTTASINEIGLEWVSQSSTDYREWFGYNGNPQNDGEKAFLVQRGLHKVAGNGLGFSVANAASYSVGTPIYWDNINSVGAMTVVRPTSGQVLRLGYIAGIQDDPTNPYVREMWYDPFWEEGQTFYNAKLSGSVTLTNSNLLTTASINTGSFATTGSNTFTGAQIVSSSVSVFGNNLVVRNAANTSTIGTTTISVSSGSAGVNTVVNSTMARGYIAVNSQSVASANQVGLVPGPVPFGLHNTAPAGGGISVFSGSAAVVATPYYPIQFQTAAGYTDGRVTFATPISASAGFTGSVTIKGNQILSGSFNIQSSSLFSQATASALVSYDTASGQFYHTTYQSALPALFDVGAFYSTITQSGSANVSGAFVFDNTIPINSINLTSGSRINVPKSAYYNFQFSIQISQGSGDGNVAVWLKKNDSNVTNTATYIDVPSNKKAVLALNIWDSGSAGDYYEIAYQSDSGNTTYSYVAPTGNIPASPSIILTVNQVR